jgi:hypothetical protein
VGNGAGFISREVAGVGVGALLAKEFVQVGLFKFRFASWGGAKVGVLKSVCAGRGVVNFLVFIL